jgi:hypothetical protein
MARWRCKASAHCKCMRRTIKCGLSRDVLPYHVCAAQVYGTRVVLCAALLRSGHVMEAEL